MILGFISPGDFYFPIWASALAMGLLLVCQVIFLKIHPAIPVWQRKDPKARCLHEEHAAVLNWVVGASYVVVFATVVCAVFAFFSKHMHHLAVLVICGCVLYRAIQLSNDALLLSRLALDEKPPSPPDIELAVFEMSRRKLPNTRARPLR